MRSIAKFFAGPGLMAAGTLHFVKPGIYEPLMPGYLPAHRELIYASGVTEFLAGAGSLHPRTRRAAGVLGILTMLGVFPANIEMVVHPENYKDIPVWASWARLPLQAVFIWWIYRATLAEDATAPEPAPL